MGASFFSHEKRYECQKQGLQPPKPLAVIARDASGKRKRLCWLGRAP